MNENTYSSPFNERYSSDAMCALFSADNKFSTWRKLWIALAVAEKDLGLPISQEAIDEMQAAIHDIDYAKAAEYEAAFRHDVMAHIHAFADKAPAAKSIIHLGATSAYVGDNADIIISRDALLLIRKELINVMSVLADFALERADLPTLGFTHFQAAQLTTVGKRACLWLTDLMSDYEELEFVLSTMKLRGAQGTTGTQASFMDLFEGDESKIDAMNAAICEAMGFSDIYMATGQTYPRKLDDRILHVLSSIAQSLHKFATDLRLLAHLKEIEEPFGSEQVGSSAMPYKRNPMKAERICSLARFVISLNSNTAMTASLQWFERTLDDSANRRLSISQAFLACDAILHVAWEVIGGLVVNEAVIRSDIMKELPFMATENLMMEAVKQGGDRQDLHERIRRYSLIAADAVKKEGKENPMLDLMAEDEGFPLTRQDIDKLLEPSQYTGRAPSQTRKYVNTIVRPIIDANKDLLGMQAIKEV